MSAPLKSASIRRSEAVAHDDRARAAGSAITEIGFDDPIDAEAVRDGADLPDPQYVWVRYAVEAAPEDGLDYRADLPIRRHTDTEIGGAGLVRALTDLVGTVQRVVGSAMSASGQPVTASTTGPYSTANLPPGTSARAFGDAIRNKRVRFAVVAGRNMVLAADWENYVASCVKKAKPVRANVTDDELLASVGSRKGGRK